MNTTKAYIKISKLIYKERTDLLSDSEKNFLDVWKNESEENLAIYNTLNQDLNLDSKKNEYDQIDSGKAWLKIESQLKAETKIRILFKEFIRCVAVLILPLAIGGYLVYNAIDSVETYDEVFVDNITPGTQKATLVLSNGEMIDLEEQQNSVIKTTEGDQLNNSNHKLSYNSNQLPEMKIKWHRLVVPKGGEYQLQLSDGTQVWLNSDSELKYTDRFVGKDRIVYLKGEAYFDVAKDKEHAFIVKSTAMDVKVYGTEFNMMVYDDEDVVNTTLVEGKVGVDLKNETGIVEEIRLEPNMQVAYIKGGVKGEVRMVDAGLYTGWKDGLFQFNDEDLGSILRKLSRWYNVKVFFQNPSIKNIRFTGEMKRFEDFVIILNLLELGSGVEFQVKGDVLTVIQKI